MTTCRRSGYQLHWVLKFELNRSVAFKGLFRWQKKLSNFFYPSTLYRPKQSSVLVNIYCTLIYLNFTVKKCLVIQFQFCKSMAAQIFYSCIIWKYYTESSIWILCRCVGVFYGNQSRSGELRTQKLRSHLVRTQSLKVLPFKPGVVQHIAIHAKLTARDFFLAYFYPSSPFTCIFSKTSPNFFLCWPAE